MGHYLNKVREWEKKRAAAAPVTPLENKERIKKALRERGVVAMRSETLDGEIIYFARDEKAAEQVSDSAAVYTLKELLVIVQNPPGKEDLKRIHTAKKLFNGTVVD